LVGVGRIIGGIGGWRVDGSYGGGVEWVEINEGWEGLKRGLGRGGGGGRK
jgi:hypothetical protein